VADIVFSGKIILELSIIVVIYFGFRLDLIKGAISSFILGFTFDCISGSVLGLFTLIYVLIFLFSFFTSTRLATERLFLIALFAIFCSFVEEFIIFSFYKLIFGFDILSEFSYVFLFQALIIGLLAPVFFYMMRRVEVIFYGKPAQSSEWTGTGRIPAEN
jgi:rod shape-determining protein MreD